MSLERAKAHLKVWGLEDRVMKFPASGATCFLSIRFHTNGEEVSY